MKLQNIKNKRWFFILGILAIVSVFSFTTTAFAQATSSNDNTTLMDNSDYTYMNGEYVNANDILRTNLDSDYMNSTSVPKVHSDFSHMWWSANWHRNWNDNWWSGNATSTNDNNNSTNTPVVSRKIVVPLTGSEEVPPSSTSMTANATFWIYSTTTTSTTTNNVSTTTNDNNASTTKNLIDYRIDVTNGQNVTAVHLHCGLPGTNGPVIVNLYRTNSPETGVDVNGLLASETIEDNEILSVSTTTPGCTPQINNVSDLIQAIKDGRIYANLHTIERPNGEIRGQIRDDTATSSQSVITEVRGLLNELLLLQNRLLNLINSLANNSNL